MSRELRAFVSNDDIQPVENTIVNIHVEEYEELEWYRRIGGIGLFQILRLRDKPTKCIQEKLYSGSIEYRCPNCKKPVISKINGEWCAGKLQKYCDNCGQHLDWEGE